MCPLKQSTAMGEGEEEEVVVLDLVEDLLSMPFFERGILMRIFISHFH